MHCVEDMQTFRKVLLGKSIGIKSECVGVAQAAFHIHFVDAQRETIHYLSVAVTFRMLRIFSKLFKFLDEFGFGLMLVSLHVPLKRCHCLNTYQFYGEYPIV
ncbi:hypothetical protein PSDVSF_32620 [Pseudodesulfovibrio sediminis]|uniref:Acetolactate decarboxylase n=1 Tax=Pseudodesulfovibrio sediminis TaxID=2810563 RepID=A0ABM7PAA4_9BACT|nr:hypothetical protein PSDVSF_32620 [Pseudodesulfovibrio sediminis]